MTRKIVIPAPGVKDSSGAYIRPEAIPPTPSAPPDVSIKRPNYTLDDMINSQLLALEKVTQQLTRKSHETTGLNKDDIASLSTVIKLTLELKAKEKALLESMTDEELEEAAAELENK